MIGSSAESSEQACELCDGEHFAVGLELEQRGRLTRGNRVTFVLPRHTGVRQGYRSRLTRGNYGTLAFMLSPHQFALLLLDLEDGLDELVELWVTNTLENDALAQGITGARGLGGQGGNLLLLSLNNRPVLLRGML